ncbi:MAG: hypothetical protein JXQ90_19160 [Cyclobacteriaceae bacterium]
MNINKALYRHAAIYFVIFFILAIWAFWPNYFSHILTGIPFHIHVHGITMSLWCLTLIAQGFLIRYKQFKIHGIIGKFSYVLAPLIIISGFNTAHVTLSGFSAHSGPYYSSIALMFNSLLLFGLIYGLAIYHVRKPLVHARYMVCTLFPMFTPLTDRLIYVNFRSMVGFFPTIEGLPMVWLFGFGLATILLVLFAIWDWKSNKRRDVFLTVLALNMAYNISVIYFHRSPLWRDVGDWIMSLPLS